MKGIAALSETTTPVEISKAIKKALIAVGRNDLKADITNFVKEHFCMQQQLKPLVYFLNEIITTN